MGLGVVSRFSTLVEAEVVCCALGAAGFHAHMLERNFGTMLWTHQVAIGGFRVVVPDTELADAVAFLAEAPRRRRRSPLGREPAVAWRLLALVAGLFVAPQAGWVVLGVRDRIARGSALRPWPIFLVSLVLTLAATLAVLIFALLGAFIDGWLIHPVI